MKKTITFLLTQCFCLLAGIALAQPTPEVLYYKFDGTGTSVPNYASAPPTGTTTATIMGSITQGAGGLCGGALIGSGNASSTDYLNTGWAPNLGTGSWTVSMYTKDITASATLFYIFGDANTTSFRCFTNGVAGANNWILRGPVTDVLINGGATVAPHLNTWVYDATAGNIKAYLDGVLVNTVAQGAVNLTGTGPLKVMGYATNVGSPSGGKVDEFRFYSRALTAAEVLELMTPHTTSTATVAACGSYVSPAGNTYTTAGTYLDTIPNMEGCDSIITTNLTINQPSSASMTATACGSYTAPSGRMFTSTGTYMDTIQNIVGCDSIITIGLTVNQPSAATISPSACVMYVAPSGAMYTSSGMYMDTIPNMAGCDSVITINLTVNQPTSSSMTATACDMYTAPSGAMYMTSGTYMDTIPNVNGCDSVMTIDLTVLQSSTSSMTATACDMYTAPSGATFATSGTYTDIIPNMAGCDSIITINLTVNPVTTSSMTTSACDSYTAPSGAVYTSSGTYMDTIPNMAGCDSVITINLTVNMSSAAGMPVASCGPYTAPSGAVLTASGTYTDIIPNAAGCDSVITIVFTNNAVNNSVTQAGGTLTAVQTGATYQWIDCNNNNSPIAGATSQSFTATVSGNYAVVITGSSCTDTSNCMVINVGIEENTFASQITLYPNPNQGQFQLNLGAAYNDVIVTITDVTGRVVYAESAPNATSFPVQLNAAPGMYTIHVTAGSNNAVLRFVKQ